MAKVKSKVNSKSKSKSKIESKKEKEKEKKEAVIGKKKEKEEERSEKEREKEKEEEQGQEQEEGAQAPKLGDRAPSMLDKYNDPPTVPPVPEEILNDETEQSLKTERDNAIKAEADARQIMLQEERKASVVAQLKEAAQFKLRPALVKFVIEQEIALRRGTMALDGPSKLEGNWWLDQPAMYLLTKLIESLGELARAVWNNRGSMAKEKATEVGNLAMMIADKCR